MFSSSEVVAALRSRAIFHLKVVEPLRFLTNDKEIGFNSIDIGTVLDALFEFLTLVKDDGALLLDLNVDIFMDHLEEEHQQIYQCFLAKRFNQKGKSCDGKTEAKIHNLIVAELYEPSVEIASSSRDFTVAFLSSLAAGYLDGMLKSPTKDHLSHLDGHLSQKCATDQTELT